MVLSKKIRITAGAASFMALALFFSCEKTFPGMIICRDCLDQDPLKANLELQFSPAHLNTVEIYEGNLEDSILYKTYATGGSTASIVVLINKKYTLVAKYYIPDDYFYVINSVTPRAKYDEVQCEKPCYYVVDNVVDLRLKNVK
jgi:hypothetical protein